MSYLSGLSYSADEQCVRHLDSDDARDSPYSDDNCDFSMNYSEFTEQIKRYELSHHDYFGCNVATITTQVANRTKARIHQRIFLTSGDYKVIFDGTSPVIPKVLTSVLHPGIKEGTWLEGAIALTCPWPSLRLLWQDHHVLWLQLVALLLLSCVEVGGARRWTVGYHPKGPLGPW